jgi:hypothetical protein
MMKSVESGEVVMTICIGQILGDILFHVGSGDAAFDKFVAESELV